ncbi:YlbF family regulator [Bacillus fonticola]|uniref:YlbF family regulator n=1 Tax=Bacillus fonticola TaxID=2728853 RepID=UPI0014736BB2|nr:YlbF family regulator [Bacillus fonticola]
MATNVYDVAYELETAVRQSEEYTKLQAAYQVVQEDEAANRMFQNFRDIQMKLQQKQMAGQEIQQEEVEQAQKVAQLVQQNAEISKLMEAEQRMSQLITEINKISMKPLEDLYQNMNLG